MGLKWTVGAKIAAGFGLGLVALVVVGLIAFSSTNNLIDLMNRRDASRVRQVDTAQLLYDAMNAQAAVEAFVLTGEEGSLNSYKPDDLTGDLARLRGEGAAVADWDSKVNQIDSLLRDQQSFISDVLNTRRTQGAGAATDMLVHDARRLTMSDLRVQLLNMQLDAANRSSDYAADAQRGAGTTIWAIAISTLVAMLLLALAAFLITRSMSLALKEITRAAERIAAGDLSVDLEADRRSDEVGVLKRAFARMVASLQQTAGLAEQIAEGNLRVEVRPQSERDTLGNAFSQMVDKLRLIMNDLREASNTLAASTTEILATTNQIAAGAAQTASAVAETTATVEQVKQTAHLSSEKAREVSDSAYRSSEVSNVGNQAVDEATQGMEKIREQMDLVADSIVRLSEQRQAIGEIISTVNDLAEQSNLLAVNAAIEAAKAGEHGRGFAVVAQEVRRLAEQSKAATAQVRSILSDIEKATTAAVLATEQGSKAVSSGARQSQSAGEAIRELAENINESTRAATQIAASSQQQLIGMDQIAEAMENINQASLQNVASTRQATVSAQNLNDLGQRLKLVLAQYRV